MGNKEYNWIGKGTINIRGKLYGNGPIPTGGIDQKVLDRLIKRGDIEEVKPSKKEPVKESTESEEEPKFLSEVKKKIKRKGKK